MNALVSLLVWGVYFGASTAAILVDARLQRASARREGRVDFQDRNPWSYIALGLLCGPLPVIVYFGVTRKNAKGWLLGVGVAVLVWLTTGVAAAVLNVLTRRASF